MKSSRIGLEFAGVWEQSREYTREGITMIYAIARFDWLGLECTASLGPKGWKVPRSLGVEAALNVVARLTPSGPMPGCPVDNALDAVLRIFPNAEIDRFLVKQAVVSDALSAAVGGFPNSAQTIT